MSIKRAEKIGLHSLKKLLFFATLFKCLLLFENNLVLKSYYNIDTFSINPPKTILTLGTFDGVHLGHKMVLNRLISQAEKLGYESTLLTFFPHPRMVLQKDSNIKLLNTIEEKKLLLEKAGLQNLIIHPFDVDFSRLTAEEFVKNILVDKLNIGKIIIGYDHRFGRNRTADINDLIAFGKQFGFEVEQISAEEINEIPVSSTKVRNALLEGNITEANAFLGYNYSLTGKVVHGKKLGRTIGFPTANIEVKEDYKLIPKNGVYVIIATVDSEKYYGMMSVGLNPTLSNEKFSIEAYLFDFNADIYGKEIKIEFLERIRDEEKFESIDILKSQIQKDQDFSLQFIKSRNEQTNL